MAQFGKHLFGTSFFGKSNSFIGVYDTRMVDAGESFDGTVRVSLENSLPSKVYTHKDRYFQYEGAKSVGSNYTTINKDSSVGVYLSGKNFKVLHGAGKATITVYEEDTKEERTYTTNESGELLIENFPDNKLKNYVITITATENFQFKGIEAVTTEIQAYVRATTEEKGRTNYFLKGHWPLNFEVTSMDEHNDTWIYHEEIDLEIDEKGRLTGETTHFNQARYIQVKLILLTTDDETTPRVQEIHFYSGDLSKYRNNGRWQTTLDMKNLAAEKGRTFKRVKRVEWIEKEEEQSQFDLHSSSRNGSTPSILNIMNDSYWSDLTAKYVLKHNGSTYGRPYDRISLKERNNGSSESARIGSVMFGPINPLTLGFTNTEIAGWHSFIGKQYYPRNSNRSHISIEFYQNKNDIQNGIPALFILEDPEILREYLLDISNKYDNLYVRILFTRDSSFSSAVFDEYRMYSDLKYESSRTSNNYSDELSPLDGCETNNTIGKGRKLVRSIKLNAFDWPNRNQVFNENRERILDSEKRVRIEYSPRYVNQSYIGLGSPDNQNIYFTRTYPSEFLIHSQVYADEPVSSTQEVPRDRLYWHYSYDGGSVNYPVVTKRELTTQFTPNILQNKKYRYRIENGWSDQTFIVPFTMTFEEVADITFIDVDKLKEINKNVPLYDENILVGYELNLPNDTLNPLINLKFEKTGINISDFSMLNDKEHDKVHAWINDNEHFKYLDWTSDEILFEGIINYNDEELPYIRTQNSSYNALQRGNHIVSKERETAIEIASRYSVDVEDLLVLNNRKEIFNRNETVVVPGGYSLPDIAPGLIYEGDNPYVIEIIPGSVRRTEGNVRLPNDVLIAGSEDENAISYTLTESNTEDIYITRGEVRNGRDHLPVSNVIEIHEIVNQDTGVKYVPKTSTMGDYELKEGHIDWSASFGNSKEPASGEIYRVTLTRGVIDNLRIVYTSNYIERMSQDRMEAIPFLSKEYEVDLKEDMVIELPEFEEMQKEYPHLKNMRYIAENSDLWVNHEIEDNKIRLTLNGEDPNVNWYPTIQTGFYYLNDQEHYLYSRPIQTLFDDKDIPVIRNVEYTASGLRAPREDE